MIGAVIGWETLGSVALGALAGAVLPANFYGAVASEIVTVLGFLMAALVPAMVLAASSIRCGVFSVKEIDALRSGLNNQINIFGVLFYYCLISCIILIYGKSFDWKGSFFIKFYGGQFFVNLAFLWPSLITFLLTFLALRSANFIISIKGILDLQSQIAVDEARIRLEQKATEQYEELKKYQMPEGYADRVDLPN